MRPPGNLFQEVESEGSGSPAWRPQAGKYLDIRASREPPRTGGRQYKGICDYVSMTMRLRGLTVACFFPYQPFVASGGWARFTLLYRFLLSQGAHVILPTFGVGQDCTLKDLSVRYANSDSVFHNVESYRELFRAARQDSNLKELSEPELQALFMFDSSLYDVDGTLSPWLRDVVAQVDIVMCDCPFLVQLLSPVCKETGKRLVVTCYDCLHDVHGVTPFAAEQLKYREIAALRKADAVVFCSDSDREHFRREGIDGAVVPNVCDVFSIVPASTLSKGPSQGPSVQELLGIAGRDYCLFVGSDHRPNNTAARFIRETLAPKVPDVVFVVAGGCHPSGRERNFVACGPVGEGELSQLYRDALAVIIPLEGGGGTSLKTFEALSHGVPVISTRVGVRGLSVSEGHDVLVCGSTSEMAPLVSDLRRDRELRAQLATNGRRFAERWDFRRSFMPYADIIERFVEPSRNPRHETTTLRLIDNNLRTTVGHHFGYAVSLHNQCALQGREFTAYVSAHAEQRVLNDLGAHPSFTVGIHETVASNPFPEDWGALHTMHDLSQGAQIFKAELEAAFKGDVATQDVVFIPNAMPHQVLGLALLLKHSPLYRQVQFVLMFRYALDYPVGPLFHRASRQHQSRIDAFAHAFASLNKVSTPTQVRYCTDSEGLASDYVRLSQRPLEVFPIPHTLPAVARSARVDLVPPKQHGRIRMVFLGDAREEKGFELLAELVEVVLQAHGLDQVEFVLQAFLSSEVHQAMQPSIDRLVRLQGERVRIVQQALDEPEYFALLESADVVLLPYDAVTYRSRTSGPFVEALTHGKPVIVPHDTWMAKQLGNSGAGVRFTSGNIESLGVSLVQAAHQLHEMREAAHRMSQSYRDFHNAENFLRNHLLRPLVGVESQCLSNETSAKQETASDVASQCSRADVRKNIYISSSRATQPGTPLA